MNSARMSRSRTNEAFALRDFPAVRWCAVFFHLKKAGVLNLRFSPENLNSVRRSFVSSCDAHSERLRSVLIIEAVQTVLEKSDEAFDDDCGDYDRRFCRPGIGRGRWCRS